MSGIYLVRRQAMGEMVLTLESVDPRFHSLTVEWREGHIS